MKTKELVLQKLIDEKNNTVSGEKLAEFCKVSRTAIWKAVNTLRKEGFDIKGTTNGGYVLWDREDVFSDSNFIFFLQKHFPEFSDSFIKCFTEIDSTNTYAKSLLSSSADLKQYNNAIIVSEAQTKGRGRLGRNFISLKKTGIYQSVIVVPDFPITEPAMLTASSAVALCRVLKRLYNIDARIKWINDIFYNGKKLAGILTEGFTNFENRCIDAAVIGIGINIKENPDFPEEVKKIATSIEQILYENQNSSEKIPLNRCELSACICGETLKILQEDMKTVMKEYKEYSFLIGKKITVHPVINQKQNDYKALVLDINEKAELIVRDENGNLKTLVSGEVSLHSAKV